jgi:hypothetical protein
VLILRAFAEAEGTAGLAPSPEDVASHVKDCERCARVVALARKEEAALSRLGPVLPAGSARGLERTLAALDAVDEGAPSLLPRILLALLGTIAVAGILLFVLRPSIAPEPEAPPREEERPRTPPTPTPPKPPTAPKEPEKPAPPAAPTETPDEPPTRPEKPPEPPAPDEPLVRVDPAPAPVEGTKTPEPTRVRALAFARAGKLTVLGRTLAPGEPLPEGTTVAVGPACAEVESVGSATIVLAPRSSFTVSAGDRGEPVLALESGKVFARSSGAVYAIATRDGRATPTGTAFVVAVETGGTRVTTLEGSVHLDGADAGSVAVDVRPGFEARLARGKGVEVPRPCPAAAAVDWLPAARRPKKIPAPPRILKSVSFDEAVPTLSKGQLVPATKTEPGHARGAAGDGGATVSLWGQRLVDLAPDVRMEVVLRVDRACKVTLMLWDDRIKENFAVEKTVEPGRWTLVGTAIRELEDKAKLGRAIEAGDVTHEIDLYASGGAELLVREIRFTVEGAAK